jgi:hypothetical protein
MRAAPRSIKYLCFSLAVGVIHQRTRDGAAGGWRDPQCDLWRGQLSGTLLYMSNCHALRLLWPKFRTLQNEEAEKHRSNRRSVSP